jgi:hypothetical protein
MSMTITGDARHAIASKLLLLADQDDRERWLEDRRGGLGGSDMAAICGENQYKSPIDVWESIRGEADELKREGDMQDRLDMGHILEPTILEQLAAGAWRPAGDRKLAIWRPPLVARRDRLWHRGSADGMGVLDTAPGYYIDRSYAPDLLPPNTDEWWAEIAECKTHGYWAAKAYARARAEEGEDTVPPDKLIQTAWYAELWEVPTISLCALVDTHLRRYWRWPHSKALGTDLLTIAEEWWNRHIIGGIKPDPDGTDRYAAHLRKLYPTSKTTQLRASPELEAVVEALLVAREREEAIETEVERLTQIIQTAMGETGTLVTRYGSITWANVRGRVQFRPALDELYATAGLSKAQRDAHEDKHRGAAGRQFRVNAKLGAKRS